MSQIRRPSTRWAFYLRSSHDSGVIRCAYCGSELDARTATLDHIVAQDRGGSNDPRNIVVACAGCNRAKSNRRASAFIADLALDMAHGVAAQLAPSGCSDAEFAAGHRAIAADLALDITARVRRERRRALPRAAGRMAAKLNAEAKPNRAIAA